MIESPEQKLTADRLRKVMRYDPISGIFIWIDSSSNKMSAGDIAGSVTAKGYIAISVDGRKYRAHRLAWLYMHGEWPTNQIDHKNTVRTDNRWENLRQATNAENGQNRRAANKNNKSGLLGVSPSGHRWVATIVVCGKKIYLGTFETPELAHAAYLLAKSKMHSFGILFD